MTSWKKIEHALKVLHKSIPALQMGYRLLFLPPVEHILCCFSLEPISEEKGAAYLWRVVIPLYRPPTFLILNYAERLLGGEKVSVLETDLDRTVDRLVQVISQGELDYLKGIRSSQDFLQKIDWKGRPATPNYRLDLALTHYMAGNVPACSEILEQVVSTKFSPRWAEDVRLVQELAEELKVDPAAMSRRLETWEERNIYWFGLAPRTRRKVRTHSLLQ